MKAGALLIVLAALAFAALLVWAIEHEIRTTRDFFAECETERPHYECLALWRGG